jgi:autotransporter-associated beta strand protein
MQINSSLSLLTAFCLTVGLGRASASQLTWDPNGNGGTTSGSGNWDTTAGNAVWYNGSGDVVWTENATNNATTGAVFGGGDGAYAINVDAVNEIATTNIVINNSGYTFSGNPIYLGNGDYLTVAPGKTVTFDCNVTGTNNGAQYWPIGSDSVLNMVGAIGPGTTQVRLAGPTNSAFYLTGNNNPSIIYALAPVYLNGGSTTIGSTLYIGYQQTIPTTGGTTYTSGSLTVNNGATLTASGNVLIIGRSGGSGTLTLNNGTVNVGISGGTARPLALCYDNNGTSSGTLNVFGGTLNVGLFGSPSLNGPIEFFQGGSTGTATAIMNQTNGEILAWGGITFGASSGTFTGGSAALTNSGGFLYIGPKGITQGAAYPPSLNITLSGGTVGALASWSSSMPMTLGTANGNITFQCADNGSTPNNISLAGPLTGPGGLNVTGSGTLTLSGTNTYAGSTVISNGTLAIVTGSVPSSSGPVVLDASQGAPALTIESSAGQYWTNNGTLTFQNGTATVNFEFSTLAPSTSVAPLQVNGNVAFASTPTINVSGSAIATGTYPLITYTGAVSGAMPTAVTLTGGSASAGYLENITASKTIALVVTNSSYTPALYWAAGSGIWDIGTTADWKEFNTATTYTDGNAVVFDDSASGPSPITVTLNTTVDPLDVTFNNKNDSYSITGSGNISGAGTVSVLNSGTVTLATANTYSGGTVISAGQLNINNGGTASASAIGTGQLTINNGATMDDTSGSDVTLQPSIPEVWNGNFAYLGSSNNFNTGTGGVTMSQNISVAVNSNNLTIGGSISDNELIYALTKTGTGTLTLAVDNNFYGGMTLFSGQLDLGSSHSLGFGAFTIDNGATIDNSSGAPMTMIVSSCVWAGNFTFLGSTNLDLGTGTVNVPVGPGSVTVTVVSNTLNTDGNITSGNTTVIKSGPGTWTLAGTSTSANNLQMTISEGLVNFAKTAGQSIGGGTIGLTIQSNAQATDLADFQVHSDTSTTPLPVNLSGGIWDLNGHKENVDKLFISSSGILRNGAAGTSTINTISGYTAMLSGTNCQFDVTLGTGVLNFDGVLGNTGSLVKTGLGALNLASNNIYSGNTVISDGILALMGVGSISNTAVIDLVTTNSCLDLTGSTDINSNSTPLLTLQSGQTLTGFGTVTGMVMSVSGSTVAPGSPSAIGILTVTGFSGANTLDGVTEMKLDKGHATNDQLNVSGSLAYGGTLVLTNLSGSLAVGDTFKLFNALSYSGSFASLTPSTPGNGLAWDTSHLASSGTLGVIGGVGLSPASFGVTKVSGTTLTLAGSGGTPNGTYRVFGTTNLVIPVISWAQVGSGSFDSSGNFSFPTTINTNNAAEFYILEEP